MESVEKTIKRLRNPEVRTRYSDMLIELMQAYLKEIYEQPNPPTEIQTLKDNNVVYVPYGSVLRGTADPNYRSDIEIAAFAPTIEIRKLVDSTFDGLLHPQRKRIGEYFKEKSTRLQLEGVSGPTPPGVTYWSTDLELSITHHVRGNPYEAVYGLICNILVSLLTTNASLVFEPTLGALLYNQRQIIQMYADLQVKNSEVFTTNWERLEGAFIENNVHTQIKHPKLDANLLRSYVERSNRFPGKETRVAGLLRSVRKAQTLPSLQSFQSAFGISPHTTK